MCKNLLTSSTVFTEESLDVIICNGLSFRISTGLARSKSICGSELVLADKSIMKKDCFQSFTINQFYNKQKESLLYLIILVTGNQTSAFRLRNLPSKGIHFRP